MSNPKLRRIGAIVSIIVGAIYLINPTAGAIELLPDILPVLGNLDEAGATALLLWGIQQLRQPNQLPPPNQPNQLGSGQAVTGLTEPLTPPPAAKQPRSNNQR
jgi:hypothetical protein